MHSPQQRATWRWSWPGTPAQSRPTLERKLLWVTDAGLFATICVAPFVFGGRHDLGRLVYSTLIAIAATAWLIRMCILPKPCWTRTAAHGILLLAVALLVGQLIPLPRAAIEWLAPRTVELLPLWMSGDSAASLGSWRTLTLTPHESTLSLCMLVAYSLLFVVVSQRVESAADVGRLLTWIGFSSVLMAAFGLVQYFTGNDRFFWFYEHPFRTADDYVKGSFANRNHFAHFLVLGAAPLIAWFIATAAARTASRARRKHPPGSPFDPYAYGSIVAIALVVLAILLSLSRGGALALAASTATLSAIYLRWRHLNAKHAAGAVSLVVMMFGLLSIYGYERVATRLDDFTDGSVEALDRNEGRRTIWSANIAAFKDGWLTGAGAGSHREIYPIYLDSSPRTEYTHAESGYLQIATETGLGGIALLAASFGLCGYWCHTCLSRLKLANEQLYFGAIASGLVASAVHSLVDFVWYIPACMSVTVILAACALRLAQIGLAGGDAITWRRGLSRPRCRELAAAGILAGTCCVYTLFAPAMASIHWDRYLRASVDKTKIAHRQLSILLDREAQIDSWEAEPLVESMIHCLEETAQWDPAQSRAQLRLASLCLARFELLQQKADNAMTLFQIREAARASRFASSPQLRTWLEKAVGENVGWLYRAYEHAHHAVALCPLQGEAYLHLANLCFLDGASGDVAEAYANQGLLVRPHDADVLFEAGNRTLMAGDLEAAIGYWRRCFHDRGRHQRRIVYALAGQYIPAAMFLDVFEPDWHTLREIWSRYRQSGSDQDVRDLLAYATKVTDRDVREQNDIPPACIWLWQASMYSDVGRSSDAVACLEQAYRLNPQFFDARFALGRALLDTRRFAEAEPHIRWCLARRPENKFLKAALLEVSKQRFSERDAASLQPR